MRRVVGRLFDGGEVERGHVARGGTGRRGRSRARARFDGFAHELWRWKRVGHVTCAVYGVFACGLPVAHVPLGSKRKHFRILLQHARTTRRRCSRAHGVKVAGRAILKHVLGGCEANARGCATAAGAVVELARCDHWRIL